MDVRLKPVLRQLHGNPAENQSRSPPQPHDNPLPQRDDGNRHSVGIRTARRRPRYRRSAQPGCQQVASQTIETLRVTGSHTDLPVLRPVIGFDKQEIIRIAEKIGTYETSILPYDDCCTLFSPEHPEITPDFAELQKEFARLNLSPLIEQAAASAERLYFHPKN